MRGAEMENDEMDRLEMDHAEGKLESDGIRICRAVLLTAWILGVAMWGAITVVDSGTGKGAPVEARQEAVDPSGASNL